VRGDMSVRISSKEILAKLMATENILVEHTNIPTAAFDLINRKLLLPNWKDISDSVYTLLISHEVGHALYTPKDEWESAVKQSMTKDLKSVINIVEDVRIEKMIQQQYPGTVRSFKAGYDELEKMNIFGTVDANIEDYGLLDRLNIHFKVGHFGYVSVPFSDNEKQWLSKVSSCKSFSDVVSVAQELLQYVKDNPESQGKESKDSEGEEGDGEGQSGKTKKIGRLVKGEPQEGDSDAGDLSDIDELIDPDGVLKDALSKPSDEGAGENPLSVKTQEHFEKALQELVDKSNTTTCYANLPNIILDRIVVPYKKVHLQISNYYKHYYPNVHANSESAMNTFKISSKPVVNQLANLFEMKKKAKLDVRAMTARTGVLNTNRVHSYRYSDDIFKKVTTVPTGKSHGLVMFIDMSSSMSDNIVSTFEQLLNLVLFCRRVNIPFEVYGFTDAYAARDGLVPQKFNIGEVSFEERFCLRQYFSNQMSGNEFNDALKNVLCVMQSYDRNTTYAGVPSQEQLNCTPLNSTIIAGIKVVNTFRDKYNLDIVNTVFLTDGDDTHGLSYINSAGMETNMDIRRRSRMYSQAWMDKNAQRCFIRDMKTRRQWEINNSTEDLLNMFKEMTGSKVIGFYLSSRRDAQYKIEQFVQDHLKAEKLYENFKQMKFAEINTVEGYDSYYIIPQGKNLGVKTDKFEREFDPTVDWDDEKEAKRAMRSVQKDFASCMKDIVISRVLLNKFIDHIS